MADDVSYLRGRHAVVTGGGRGIGAAIAEELARHGASVTVMGRDVARLEGCASDLRRKFGGAAGAAACDVSDDGSVAAAFAAARDALGEVHVLVNNAGQAAAGRFLDTPVETWERLLAVNVVGAVRCIRQVLPAMLAAGAGHIVNVASTAGIRGYAGIGAYSTSKHALVGLTRSLSGETARRGVAVNAVCPGYTDTGMAQSAADNLVAGGKSPEEARELIARTSPRGTLIRPEEVASVVAWLCSPGASAVSGQAVVVNGGEAP